MLFKFRTDPFLDGFSVSAGNLITTLPTWGPELKLSFELYFNSFSTTEYAQILHFKPKHNYCADRYKSYCDRVPAVFELHGKVYVYMYYSLVYSYDVSLKNWIKLEISLFEKMFSDEKVKFYFFVVVTLIHYQGAFNTLWHPFLQRTIHG